MFPSCSCPGGLFLDAELGSSQLEFELRNCTLANNRVTDGSSGSLGGGAFLDEASQAYGSINSCIRGGTPSIRIRGPSRSGTSWPSLLAVPARSSSTRTSSTGSRTPRTCSRARSPGNIDVDPDFAAPLADYHLENKFSPCMNAGDPGLALGYEFDIDGQPRISIRVEIGADERKGGILPES